MERSKILDWHSIQSKCNNQPWAASLISQLKQDYDAHMDIWPHDPPLRCSEWGHYYFCNQCGVRLEFSITEPYRHICPACGKVFSGYPYDGAWCKIMHSTIMTNMERAAILAHVTDSIQKYKTYIHDTVLFYADHYKDYSENKKHAGIGKVFPQGLSEAIFVIAMERILRMTVDLDIFTEAEYSRIGEGFFLPALKLIRPQINRIHNIHAWMNSAVAACASFLGDKKLLKESIYSNNGWFEQLEKGTSKEGIWYEVSVSYHYYTLNALLSLAWIAFENGIYLFDVPGLRNMATAYIPLVFPEGKLPAYNDGWFEASLFHQCALYEELSYSDQSFLPLLSWIYENMEPEPYSCLHSLFNSKTSITGYSRSSLAALLYGAETLPKAEAPKRKSFFLPDTGIAVLQNDTIRVNLKCTGDGGGHDHNDKNSIEVLAYDKLLSYDPGTSGYGLAFNKEWSRTSLAHNMVCIDYQRQKNSKGKMLVCRDDYVSARADDAYEGVSLIREILLKKDGFKDTFTVECEKASQIDWIFHCKGSIETALPLSAREGFKEENGYNQLFELKHAFFDKDFSISFREENLSLVMQFSGEKDTEIIVGKCYGANLNDILSFVMLRRYKKETKFIQETNIIRSE